MWPFSLTADDLSHLRMRAPHVLIWLGFSDEEALPANMLDQPVSGLPRVHSLDQSHVDARSSGRGYYVRCLRSDSGTAHAADVERRLKYEFGEMLRRVLR